MGWYESNCNTCNTTDGEASTYCWLASESMMDRCIWLYLKAHKHKHRCWYINRVLEFSEKYPLVMMKDEKRKWK